MRLARECGGLPSEEKVTYGTEAGLFHGAGIETVVCGPGDIAVAHTANEYVELEQLQACEAFVNALINRLDAASWSILSPAVRRVAEEAKRELARFDAEQGAQVAAVAPVLLRSEAASLSHIENPATSSDAGTVAG